MNGRNAKNIRKGINEMERRLHRNDKQIAKNLVKELMNASFKYRFLFALKIIFKRF